MTTLWLDQYLSRNPRQRFILCHSDSRKMSNFYEIQKLVELFNPKKDDNSDSESDADAENFATGVEKPKEEVTQGM